ncbi:hypothetical protein QYE76_020462 [Lolium multiflorum]|uniref:Uncharacterized protein n=1 Tax=Lolium multiflorum TaxID=4521 RepID=A0AAD8VRW9_LOLMU|nr:hypothetical protein QYE76_020462 [Lolium multiflorum]
MFFGDKCVIIDADQLPYIDSNYVLYEAMHDEVDCIYVGELMPEDDIIDGFENLQVLSFEYYWINSLSHLFYVDVSDNRLTGEIPLTLTEIPMLKRIGNTIHYDPKVFKLPAYNGPSLQYRGVTSFPTVLNLSHNYFAGVIPPQIGRLKVLVVLDFSFNKLSGQIPQSICSLTSLQVLDLSSNNFTGEIPAALNSLHFLSAFNISNNDLEGPIPSGGQFDTFQSSSFDGNPELCGSMLIHKCDSADAHQAVILPRKHAAYKAAFVIAFDRCGGALSHARRRSRAGSWGGCKVRVEPNLREEVVDFDALGLVGVVAGVEERGMAAAS